MNEREFADRVKVSLEFYDQDDNDGCNSPLGEIRKLQTFVEAQILSANEGLIVTLKDGSEFQLLILKRK